MKRLNIALLAGGDSSEREIALQSAAQIGCALDRTKYNVMMIDVHGRNWIYTAPDGARCMLDRNDFSVTVNGVKTLLDYALILIHGTPGEDGKLQGYLDMMGISYSSCGMVSSVITFDKTACKRALADTGIPVAREVLIRSGESPDPAALAARLGMPVFIKPNASGSSFGVTKAKTEAEILPAIEAAFRESDAVLAEEFIEGREVGCGVMIAGGREYLFPVTEILSRREFFDYQAKYTAGFSEEITPAPVGDDVLRKLGEMTLKAYRACNCRGVVRVDFIVRRDGTPCLIEINSIPGMSAGSIVPKQVAQMGLSLGELYDIVIRDTYRKRA